MSRGYDDLLAPTPAWQRWIQVVALPLSVAAHLVLAIFVISRPPAAQAEASWVEMTVVEAPEAPPAEPEPPPEEAKPEPEPEPEPQPQPELDAVAFDDTVPTDQAPDLPPPTQRRVVRKVQGLSANSFAEGSGTSLGARRGNTTAVAATDETLDLDADEEFVLLPVASVTTQPKGCTRPPVDVPKEAIDAEYEGTLRMTLDLDAEGRVFRVHFLDHADHGVEDACRVAALAMRCKPAKKDGTPVSVTGMPHRCTIKALD
jgi:outer membrane biosynthesis protein TonB